MIARGRELYMPHASRSIPTLLLSLQPSNLSFSFTTYPPFRPPYLLRLWGDLPMITKAERKFDRYPYADPVKHPIPEVRAAIGELLEFHTEVKAMPHPSQLKLSPWVSYYPSRKTVVVDGDQASLAGMSVADVIHLLEERGELICPAGL